MEFTCLRFLQSTSLPECKTSFARFKDRCCSYSRRDDQYPAAPGRWHEQTVQRSSAAKMEQMDA